jgi:hypothetical protein
MKTYIITEKDIEEIKYYSVTNNDLAVDDILDSLNQLPISKKLDLTLEIPSDFHTNRAKYFVNIELDEHKTEFSKFIEENNFIKPEQPYYEKDGYIVDYGEMRELFLENRAKKI